MTLQDVGCGVGGPAREIASFSGADVVGLNYNGYQIQRATEHTKKVGLDGQVSYVQVRTIIIIVKVDLPMCMYIYPSSFSLQFV